MILLSSGCNSVKQRQVADPVYLFYVPEKVAAPQKPAMEKVSANKALNNPKEFKKMQRNITKLVTYSNALKDTVTHYELVIDEIQKMYQALYESNPNRNIKYRSIDVDPASADKK